MSITFDVGFSQLYIPEVLDDEVNNEGAFYPKLEDTEEQKPSEEASDRNEKRLNEVIEGAFKKLELFSAVFFCWPNTLSTYQTIVYYRQLGDYQVR